MAVILKFSIGSNQSSPSAERNHHCVISSLPPLEKPLKQKHQPKASKPRSKRRTLQTKAKIAQSQLGICDADYRELLQRNFGVSSSTELDEFGLLHLISYFRSMGWQDKPAERRPKDRHGKPTNMKDPFHPLTPSLSRIEALLSEIGKAKGKYVPWDYAAGILRKHTGLDCLDMATVRELQKVMVALEHTLDAERRKSVCNQ